MADISSINNLFSALGTDPDSTAIRDIQATIRERLTASNPSRLDMTVSPVIKEDLNNLSDQVSTLYRQVYRSYHKNTTFKLDMQHCLETEHDGTKSVFYPSMLLPDKSHKNMIQKLSIRFTPNSHNIVQPHKPSFKEMNWIKRTIENIPSFSNLNSLHISMNHLMLSSATWKKYHQELNSCLDRLPNLRCLRISLPSTSANFDTVELLDWLSDRYGFRPSPTVFSNVRVLGDCWDCHGMKRVVWEECGVGKLDEEMDHYGWNGGHHDWDSGRETNLEFEKELDEDDDENWNDGDDMIWTNYEEEDEDGALQIVLPSREDELGESAASEITFEERVAKLYEELFGYEADNILEI